MCDLGVILYEARTISGDEVLLDRGMIAFSKLRSLEYSALAKAKWETARVSANAQIIEMIF